MKCKCKCSYCKRKIKEIEKVLEDFYKYFREDVIKIKELELRVLKGEFIK